LDGYLTAANINDYAHLLPLVDALPSCPNEVWADRGYDSATNLRGLATRGITPHISRRRKRGQGRQQRDPEGKHRSPIERTHSWLQSFRRLMIRWDIRADIHQAFYTLAQAIICHRRLERPK
jgi:IS5 family transposase